MSIISRTRSLGAEVKQHACERLLPRIIGTAPVLVLYYDHGIAKAQTYPIVAGSRRARLRCLAGRVTNWTRTGSLGRISDVEGIFVQFRWDIPPSEQSQTIGSLRQSYPDAKIIYLDWYAPLHIPHPQMLPLVDLYVKKQVLADRARYTQGLWDTNLIEYESQWNAEFRSGPFLQVPESDIQQKLFVGWNFATAPHFLQDLAGGHFAESQRSIGIHCRICAPENRDQWYGHMRGRAYDAVKRMADHLGKSIPVVCTSSTVSFKEYLAELRDSRLCVSPFGAGEVCWRDFEAIMSGALLVKPDMAHIHTHPDVFRPHETYVPVRWDFADLEEQCCRYLEDVDQWERVRRQAVDVWLDFLQHGWSGLWNEMLLQVGGPIWPNAPLIDAKTVERLAAL
jgi:hypothetical protein